MQTEHGVYHYATEADRPYTYQQACRHLYELRRAGHEAKLKHVEDARRYDVLSD